MSIDRALEIYGSIAEGAFNEADTRAKVIDAVLKDVLGWPESLIGREKHVSVGFMDYELKKQNDKTALIVEAKKEGFYFSLPPKFSRGESSRFIAMDALLTDENISSAAAQVRGYCLDIGCDYAAITNGHQWVFFKVYEKERKWKKIPAFVIFDGAYFSKNYIDAQQKISFSAVSENGSLRAMFSEKKKGSENLFFPSEKIPAYDQSVNANSFSKEIRPITTNFFRAINHENHDFMEKCYVETRDYEKYVKEFRSIISDTLTPHFESLGVRNIDSDVDAGNFGRRIQKGIVAKKGEVITLFGGKGAGKSTFIRRVLFHNPPPFIDKHSIKCIVDFIATADSKEDIDKKLYDELILQLDIDGLLSGDRNALLALFDDEYALAKKQELFELDENSDEFKSLVRGMLAAWKRDKKLCTRALARYWGRRHKGLIVILDNTDQFAEQQDYCFSLAQQLASDFNCIAIISMREERFYGSRISGYLDAYQNSGFHISSPVTDQVFLKRVEYVLSLMDGSPDELFSEGVSREKIDGCKRLFNIFRREFSQKDRSHLNNFLTSFSHGNTRLALDLFRDLSVSGYLNVNEMISAENPWVMKIHQVLKPIMMPNRFFFSEEKSTIINIYKARSQSGSSHFTAMRILSRLCANPDSPQFISVGELREYFIENYNMQDDFNKNISEMLRRGIVEADTRELVFSSSVDSVRATSYGWYIFKSVSSYFTYIELVCTDIGYFDKKVADEIAVLSNREYKQYTAGNIVERVKTRLGKAEVFIGYLVEQERMECEHFGVPDRLFAKDLLAAFLVEKADVLRSAARLERQVDGRA